MSQYKPVSGDLRAFLGIVAVALQLYLVERKSAIGPRDQ